MTSSKILYEIPPKLVDLVYSGEANLIGAIIKDTSSGQILGHVQQTNGLLNLFPNFNTPLGLVGDGIQIYQNHQNKIRLEKILAEIKPLQNLQYCNIAVSTLGIGVTIASTLIILERLNKVEKNIEDLSQKIDKIRIEILKDLLSDIYSDIGSIDKLKHWSKPRQAAVELHHSLSKSYHRLLSRWNDESQGFNENNYTEYLDYLQMQFELIWLIQNSQIKVLFYADEIGLVRPYGDHELPRLKGILSEVFQINLRMLVNSSEGGKDFEIRQNPKTKEEPGDKFNEFKLKISSLVSQISIAETLIKKKISGFDYLKEVEESDKEKVMHLPP